MTGQRGIGLSVFYTLTFTNLSARACTLGGCSHSGPAYLHIRRVT